MNDEHYDFAVIGSGAGGSAAAYQLAAAGLKVLILERGRELPPGQSRLDIDQISSNEFHSPSGFLFRSKPAKHQEFTNLGGKTMWYGATLMRNTDNEFAADPAFQCPAWPITAQEFAPYYEEAERRLDVQIFPPEPETRKLVAHFTKNGSGWTSAAQPLGLAADILTTPEYAKQFNGRPMPPGVKRDAESAFLTPMRQMRNVRVVTGEWVVALEPDPADSRRVTSLRCKSGAVFRADHVILAAGALNSPRLLSDYVTRCGLHERMPGAHLIGRYYKTHLGSRVLALSPRVQRDVLRKTIFLQHPDFPHSIIQTWAHVNPEVVRYASAVKLISRDRKSVV